MYYDYRKNTEAYHELLGYLERVDRGELCLEVCMSCRIPEIRIYTTEYSEVYRLFLDSDQGTDLALRRSLKTLCKNEHKLSEEERDTLRLIKKFILTDSSPVTLHNAYERSGIEKLGAFKSLIHLLVSTPRCLSDQGFHKRNGGIADEIVYDAFCEEYVSVILAVLRGDTVNE